MKLKQQIGIAVALVGTCAAVQAWTVPRAVVPAQDAVRYVAVAQAMARNGWLATVRAEREYPVFPTLVWASYTILGEFGQGGPSSWADAAQWVAAAALVLAIVPLYSVYRLLVPDQAALAGSLFFCVAWEISRLGGDGLADSTHLLLLSTALWGAMAFLQGSGVGGQGSGMQASCRSLALPFATGTATGLAVLSRTEAIILIPAFFATLTVAQCRSAWRTPWPRWSLGVLGFVLGLGFLLGPYLVAVGAATPKAVLDRLLGQHGAEETNVLNVAATPASIGAAVADARLADGSPMSFAVKETTVSTRVRGYSAAARQYARQLVESLGYWLAGLALFGAYRLRTLGVRPASLCAHAFFVLFSAAAIHFAAREGYLLSRHLLPLSLLCLPCAGYGALELGRIALAWSRRVSPAVAGWAVVAIAAAACLPATLRPIHPTRVEHRRAGAWLACQASAGGAVLDSRGWTGLYSGRATYCYAQARAAIGDPSLAYVVVEQQELDYGSPRSRTLRELLDRAGQRAAVFGESVPAGRAVVVYRWHPDRFAQAQLRLSHKL
ncbi:MAG: hypothetical protein ACYC35_17080 [Pirellulales bacterium]